ncbi:hypothetical protein SDC9_120284 [bioreactor metagenome]|uniref:Uncharacterized protein n=1 Tax=bioreactor metagenome TaxID=1076179 RepID=A0A645C9P4_9ZZZZ
MQADHALRAFQQPCLDKLFSPRAYFLRLLEKQADLALQLSLHSLQSHRQAQQGGGVHIMPAAVREAVMTRAVRHRFHILHAQGIRIRADHGHGAGQTALERGIYARFPDAAGRIPHRQQFFFDKNRCVVFLQALLRVHMQKAAHINDLQDIVSVKAVDQFVQAHGFSSPSFTGAKRG